VEAAPTAEETVNVSAKRDHVDRPVWLGHQDPKACKDSPGPRASWAPREVKENMADPDVWASRARGEKLVPQASPVSTAFLEFPDPLDQEDLLD